MNNLRFSAELKLWKYQIERIAERWLGTNLRPTVYTIVDFDEMSELAATHGFPVVPPHWRNGQMSIYYKKQYRYRLGKIMEMVVNTVPAYAYLLANNPLMTQKSVMAHVCGHVDLFERNAYFAVTNPRMIDTMADDRFRFETYMREYGEEKVKKFYDTLLSFENCVDFHWPYIKREAVKESEEEKKRARQERRSPKLIPVPEGLPPSFHDWLNPPEWVESRRRKLKREEQKASEIAKGVKIPEKPMRDLLLFLYRYAPLEDFEKGLIEIVRRRTYYFVPMMRTKLLHEGWASLIQEEIMSETRMLDDSEIFLFADEMARVQRRRVRGINPYRLGYELLKDIRYRWDTGRHGDIWDNCDIDHIKENWDDFVVFKNLLEDVDYDLRDFLEKWKEFLAFKQALTAGELGLPKELFVRNQHTSEYLIPMWLRYQRAEKEYRKWRERLVEMAPFEEQAKLEVARLKEAQTVKDSFLLMNKARRTVYSAAGRKDLYLWSPDEIERELVVLKRLILFKRKYRKGKIQKPKVVINEDWLDYARRIPGRVELGRGKEKLMEVTASYDDLMLIEEFFTLDFCLKHKYFLYKVKTVWDWARYPEHYFIESRSFERIKRYLIFRYTNAYQPVIEVVDGNYNNNGELYLRHVHNGVDLDYWTDGGIHIKDVLERLYYLWGKRAVHLETIVTDIPEDKPFWFQWIEDPSKKSAEEREELKGTRVIYSYGPHVVEVPSMDTTKKKEVVGFYTKTLDRVKFKAPFQN